jgi:hypothetical protein
MDDGRRLVERRLHVGDGRQHLPGDRDPGDSVSATARLSATTAATASPTQVAVLSGSGSCGADFMPLR